MNKKIMIGLACLIVIVLFVLMYVKNKKSYNELNKKYNETVTQCATLTQDNSKLKNKIAKLEQRGTTVINNAANVVIMPATEISPVNSAPLIVEYNSGTKNTTVDNTQTTNNEPPTELQPQTSTSKIRLYVKGDYFIDNSFNIGIGWSPNFIKDLSLGIAANNKGSIGFSVIQHFNIGK